MHRYVKVSDLVAQLHLDVEFVHLLDDEGLIHLKHASEGDLIISAEDAERVRLARLLTGDLDVNLPGVEVIMHMRDSMLEIQQQMSDILDVLVQEMRRRLHR
jgi:MerR family transcriptional regulator/heat shock protein HspR